MDNRSRVERHKSQSFVSNSSAVNIAVDNRPFFISILWGMILIFVPTIIMAIKTFTTSFRVDDNLLIESRGLINKTYKTVDLYRIKNVSATYSPFWTGGVLTFEMQGNETIVFDLVASPQNAISAIRQASLNAKQAHNVSILDY